MAQVSLLWLELGVLVYEGLTRVAELELVMKVLYSKVEARSMAFDFGHEELVDLGVKLGPDLGASLGVKLDVGLEMQLAAEAASLAVLA